MGDTTYCKVTCLTPSTRYFEKLGFQVEEQVPGMHTVIMIDEEGNYGHMDDFHQAGEDKVLFLALHMAGDDYGPVRYCCDGKEFRSLATGFDFDPVVEFEGLKPNPQSILNVKRFLRLEQKVKKLLGIGRR